jgi:hypothetical protein
VTRVNADNDRFEQGVVILILVIFGYDLLVEVIHASEDHRVARVIFQHSGGLGQLLQGADGTGPSGPLHLAFTSDMANGTGRSLRRHPQVTRRRSCVAIS